MIPKTREDALMAIKVCGQAHGERFDLTACALACAIHENPDRDLSPALDVLAELTQRAQTEMPKSAQALARLLYGDMGFHGGGGDYDAPSKCDLIDILTTREGLPIGLGVIWRHVARLTGAPLSGTDTPGHFIMRLDGPSEPIFLDPFAGGAILEGEDLDQIAMRAGLTSLTTRMLRPVSDLVMAVRLQTNLVSRARARGDIEAWLRSAERRAHLAPNTHQVALEFSKAAEAAGHLKTALAWAQHAKGLPDAPGQTVAETATRHQDLHHRLN